MIKSEENTALMYSLAMWTLAGDLSVFLNRNGKQKNSLLVFLHHFLGVRHGTAAVNLDVKTDCDSRHWSL